MIIHDVKQGEPEWFKLRAGKPSSSMFKSLITGQGKPSTSIDNYAMELAAEVKTGGPIDDGFFGNKYTKRGTELEPLSRSWYEMENQVAVQEVGFITDDLLQYGASTDGLVGDEGLVEFKNLITKTFMELLVYQARNQGKTPPGYNPQVQGELLVTGRKWADLVFYHPKFEPVVVRHTPDKVFQAELKKQLTICINKRNEFVKLVKGK